jgi:hypothetical protein
MEMTLVKFLHSGDPDVVQNTGLAGNELSALQDVS